MSELSREDMPADWWPKRIFIEGSPQDSGWMHIVGEHEGDELGCAVRPNASGDVIKHSILGLRRTLWVRWADRRKCAGMENGVST